MVWSRDSRCATNVEGHEAKGQSHDIKRDPSQVKELILWCFNEARLLRIIANDHVRVLMTRGCIYNTLLASSGSGVSLAV